MTTTVEPQPEQEDADLRYLVVPEHIWQREAAPVTEEPQSVEDTELYEEDLYYLESEAKPLSLTAFTGLGGAAGSILFGVAAGAVAASPVGLVAGVAAGIFGGLMGRSVAEEFYARKRAPGDD
jgi:hypothetical protein